MIHAYVCVYVRSLITVVNATYDARRRPRRTAGLGTVPPPPRGVRRTQERVRKSMQGSGLERERAGNGEAKSDADGEAKRSAGGRTAGVGVSGTHLGRLWDAFVREGRSRDVGREPLQREGSMKERKKEVRKERQK